jgi:hypothetical protein
LLRDGPRLLAAGLARGNLACVGLALDLMVPPLALLLTITLALATINVLAWGLLGFAAPLVLSAGALLLLATAVLLAWARAGRDLLSLRELACAPVYAAVKLPIYLSFLIGRQAEWVRAKRDGE